MGLPTCGCSFTIISPGLHTVRIGVTGSVRRERSTPLRDITNWRRGHGQKKKRNLRRVQSGKLAPARQHLQAATGTPRQRESGGPRRRRRLGAGSPCFWFSTERRVWLRKTRARGARILPPPVGFQRQAGRKKRR
ncbi:hypothetical protein NDU88_002363 [Pleurodeles waltl]|uniref:Uncharacterized protein n=1 Tax=Pleurodeles waltl TaxID=8319 RepID=A0AAV7NHI2_PLEWA|nr:hypothetical protein NDU88_002363 [Pleurodeles waltl]